MLENPLTVGRLVLTAVVSAATASCDSTEPRPPATHIAFVAEPAASSSADGTLGTVSVAFLDAEEQIATQESSTISLSLTAVDTSAHLTGTTTATAQSGVATFSGLSVNRTGPAYILVANAGSMEASSRLFAIVPGAPAGLLFEGIGTGVAGQPLHGQGTTNVYVYVVDAKGNSVGSGTQSITLALAASPANDTLFGTTVVQASNGFAEFSGLSLHRAGAHSLSAAAAGLTTATSPSFTVQTGPASKLAFVTQPGNGTAGSALPTFFVATTDAYDNTQQLPQSGPVTIAFGNNPTGATLSGTLTQSPLVVNSVRFNDVRVDKSGTGYTLTATAASFPTVTSNTFTVNP